MLKKSNYKYICCWLRKFKFVDVCELTKMQWAIIREIRKIYYLIMGIGFTSFEVSNRLPKNSRLVEFKDVLLHFQTQFKKAEKNATAELKDIRRGLAHIQRGFFDNKLKGKT